MSNNFFWNFLKIHAHYDGTAGKLFSFSLENASADTLSVKLQMKPYNKKAFSSKQVAVG
jgi:hypothetical protein